VTARATTERPASGSVAVRDLVRGAPEPVTVLAAFPRAVYLAATATDAPPRVVLTLVTSDGIAHPGALVLTASSAQRPFAGLAPGDTVEVGRDRVCLGHTVVRVTRWWRPRPALGPTTAAELRTRSRQLRSLVAPAPGSGDLLPRFAVLLRALRDGRGPAVPAAADALLGRGPGLTPGGDDLLAAVLAGVPLLAAAVAGGNASDVGGGSGADDDPEAARRRALVAATGSLGQHVVARAADATTAISASLLRHAVAGEVAAPTATFLQALTGRADPGPATAGLLAVGATSGRELAAGLLAAADLVVGGGVARDPVVARGTRPADADHTVGATPRRAV
jgi:hypothetical protein